MLPVSREVILTELETARDYLNKWVQKVKEGIPGVDIPVSGNAEDSLDAFLVELQGELRVVSGKCDTLAEVVSSVYTPG